MAFPTVPTIDYSYTAFQQAQGKNEFPGTQLDNDLANLADGLAEVRTFIEGSFRSDGGLLPGALPAGTDLDSYGQDLEDIRDEAVAARDEAVAAAASAESATSGKADVATTLAGYGITDAAPLTHVGAGGAAHALATTSAHGFFASTDKSKLDGIGAGANVTSVAGRTGVVTLAKADVGLGNVDNTSDANKPVSTAAQTAIDSRAPAFAANTMLVDNAAGTARETKTFAQVRSLLGVERRRFRDLGCVGDGSTDDTAAVTAALATGLNLDGEGLVYAVSAVPASFAQISHAAFKVGSIIYPSRDYWRGLDTGKITDGSIYTAWPEDKCYVVGNRIHVWLNEKESHADGTGRIVLYASDDGGASYGPGTYLALPASGETMWCAGYDAASSIEYLFVRVPGGSTDVPPYTYTMYKRTVAVGTSANYYGSWTTSSVTFPVPSGFSGQPILLISFTAGHSSSIVVGASYGEGAAVMRSTDAGANWTGYIVRSGSAYEEPSVKYDAATQRYYGFIRNGSTGNPSYWHSAIDDLSTISVYTAPTGTFGTNGLSDAFVPLAISAGRIYAFTGYRSGTAEGAASDETASAFLLDLPVTAGNVWSAATAKIYRFGTLPHTESGGASPLGVGSVLIWKDRLHCFYGVEERTGDTATRNRVANVYQTVVPLADRGELFDYRTHVAAARHGGRVRHANTDQDLVLYRNDASGAYPAIVGGRANACLCPSKLTIDGGVVTLTGRYGLYYIDTEASAATDDVNTITDPLAIDGDIVTFVSYSSSRDPTFKNATGNIRCGADRLLSSAYDGITLQYLGGQWRMIAFADNA